MQIRYQCANKVVQLNPNRPQTLLDISLANRIPHLRECGGNGRCTTCRVRIMEGLAHVSPRTAIEEKVAESRKWDETTRLACQTYVTGDVTLQRLIRTSAEVSGLQIETVLSETGEERQLAVLFCDMRQFTPFAERHLAHDVVHVLNRFFSALGEPVLLNNGVIYQYVGDELTALFGVGGGDQTEICTAAVRAGLGMLDAIERLNNELSSEFGMEIAVGVGIHFGPTIVGRVGHPSHQQFAVVGDTVNVASRIQEMNKTLATKLLISEDVFAHLPPGVLSVGKTEVAALKGKRERLTLFEARCFNTPDPTLIVQETIDKILGVDTEFADSFYRRLFTKCPHVRALFKGDPQAQAAMLTHMLKGVVYAVSRPAHLALGLRALGRRHQAYGVAAEHYALVGPVLLATIKERLGEVFTPEVETAWKTVIESILRLMQLGVTQDNAEGTLHKHPPEVTARPVRHMTTGTPAMV